MDSKYKLPSYIAGSYTCPHCLTKMQLIAYRVQQQGKSSSSYFLSEDRCVVHECTDCGRFIVWINREMVYPNNVSTGIPEPNIDMPESVLELYEEAKNIVKASPRAACALLRLSVEKLCHELGAHEKNLKQSIDKLIKEQQLPVKISKALEIVRLAGNDSAHPGLIYFDTDTEEVAIMMFELINIITTHVITEENKINSLYKIIEENANKSSLK